MIRFTLFWLVSWLLNLIFLKKVFTEFVNCRFHALGSLSNDDDDAEDNA